MSLYETKKQSVTLANMVTSANTSVTVIRSDGCKSIKSTRFKLMFIDLQLK